jgi:hypothetical protein
MLQCHVPYRNSKITRILKDSLIDPDCFIKMIVTLDPSQDKIDETHQTLQFTRTIRLMKVEERNRVNFFKIPRHRKFDKVETMEQANQQLHEIEKTLIFRTDMLRVKSHSSIKKASSRHFDFSQSAMPKTKLLSSSSQ